MITQKRCKEVWNYDPITGKFSWKEKVSDKVIVGTTAGSVRPDKYVQVRLDGKIYFVHRLIWLWMTGEFPKKSVDHINGIRYDNRWENLREAGKSDQQENRSKSKNNSTGYTGVIYEKRRNLYRADIMSKNKSYFLGYFETAEQASEAYKQAKSELHKFQPSERI